MYVAGSGIEPGTSGLESDALPTTLRGPALLGLKRNNWLSCTKTPESGQTENFGLAPFRRIVIALPNYLLLS